MLLSLIISFSSQQSRQEAAYAYYNRGLTHESLGRTDKALADFTRAIELDPTYSQAYNNRGVIRESLGRADEALADFSRAIELDPTNASAYSNRGSIYAKRERYDEAQADFTRALELDPTNVMGLVNTGALLGKRGKLQEALPYFEKAAQLGDSAGVQYAAKIKQMLAQQPRDWDYCENCGKTGAKLYQGGAYAFCSDSCWQEFGKKLSAGWVAGSITIYCPYCGFPQLTGTGIGRDRPRICKKCRGNMDVLPDKS